MPTVLDAKGTPLTFEVGGVSFTIRDFENELTIAENRLVTEAIAPLAGYISPEGKTNNSAVANIKAMASVDIALILAICTRPSKGVFDKNRVQEWREFFDNNPMPPEASEVYQRFLSIAPDSTAKFFQIFTPKVEETSEKKRVGSTKNTA